MSNEFRYRQDAVAQVHGVGDYDDDFATLEAFRGVLDSKMNIEITSQGEDEMEFELSGVDASLANALRRIMIAEVPTMAIERVLIANNTSVIQDDVLAHRLGLIPILADPELFEWTHGDEMNELNSIEFKLDVTCTGEENTLVLSSQLEWVPLSPQQAERLEKRPPRPVHDDIVIAKMRRGQTISLRMVCIKGIGQDHAKWSPVCTASYRIKPNIRLEEEFVGNKAKTLVASCPMGVFDLEDIAGVVKAKVANPGNCTMCRECVRDEKQAIGVYLGRKGDHFLYTIESVGILEPMEILRCAIRVLRAKCETLLAEIDDEAPAPAVGVPATKVAASATDSDDDDDDDDDDVDMAAAAAAATAAVAAKKKGKKGSAKLSKSNKSRASK